MCGHTLFGNREIPDLSVAEGAAGRAEKSNGRTSAMNKVGKSDSSILPVKSPNKAGLTAAEAMEGRGLAKGNSPKGTSQHIADTSE